LNKTVKKFIQLGAVMMAFSVALGAFGAHALKDILVDSNMSEVYQTANKYQFYHSLGLFVVAFVAYLKESKIVNLAGNIMLISTITFSGSLYVMTLSGIKALGMITPIGGVGFIVAWLMIFWSMRE
jgi:uncharacterized membrane protein YgdD (TMEM256/DUF423 family)